MAAKTIPVINRRCFMRRSRVALRERPVWSAARRLRAAGIRPAEAPSGRAAKDRARATSESRVPGAAALPVPCPIPCCLRPDRQTKVIGRMKPGLPERTAPELGGDRFGEQLELLVRIGADRCEHD